MKKNLFSAALVAAIAPVAINAQSLTQTVEGRTNPVVSASNPGWVLQTGSTNIAGLDFTSAAGTFSPVGGSTQSLQLTANASAASQRLMYGWGSPITGDSMTVVQFEMQIEGSTGGPHLYRLRLNETAPAFAEQMQTLFYSMNPLATLPGFHVRQMVGYSSTGITSYSASFTPDARYIYNALTPGAWYRFTYVMDHGNAVTAGPIVQRYNTTTSAYETLYGLPWEANNNGTFDPNEVLIAPFKKFQSLTFGWDASGTPSTDGKVRTDNIGAFGNANGFGRVKATLTYSGFTGHDNGLDDNQYLDGRLFYTSNFVPYQSVTMFFKDTTTGDVFFWPCDIQDAAGDTGTFHGYVQPGTYEVYAATDSSVRAQGHWLTKNLGTVTVAAGTTVNAGTASLVNGDVDGDNEVSILDYLALSAYYGQISWDGAAVPAAWETLDTDNLAPYMCDLDEDGEVSILDYLILSGNYGLTGDTPF
jgi:hypothetical protein